MSSVVLDIVCRIHVQNSIMNNVQVGDWTTEIAIIASDELESQVT